MLTRNSLRPETGIRSFAVTALAVLALVATTGTVLAQDAPLVCSVTQGVECDEAGGCQSYTPVMAAPTFLHVDLGQRLVTILAPEERRGETTAIESSDDLEDRHVLSGMQDGKGWSMSIAKPDGAMSLAISDDHVVFAAFGRCIDSANLSP